MAGEPLRIVVTGALGYVGSVLTPLLLARGYDAVALDLRVPEQVYGASAAAGALVGRFIQADIREPAAMREALASADAVIHLAALVGYPACDADPDTACSTNETGVRVVCETAPPDARLVFLSTSSIYGRVLGKDCTEAAPILPLSLYARTKACGEAVALERGCVALRPGTAFGRSPNFRPDLIIHDFALRGLRGEHLRLFEPNAIRSFIHIEDLAMTVLYALEHYEAMRGQAFNVAATDSAISKFELASRIAALTDLKVSVITDDSDPDGRDYQIDSGRLAAAGCSLPQCFDNRLRETVEWLAARFRTHQESRG